MAKRAAKKPKPSVAKEAFTAKDIVLRSPDDLVSFPNNPKVHTASQIDAIAESIKTFGFDQPALVDEDSTILKGHGRTLAARKLGVMVPTIVRKGLSFEDKWAIVISDNAIPAMTGFDNSLLRIGLTTLAKADYDLKLTGFDNVRLATFGVGASAPQSDPDEEVEPEAIPISKRGDIWLLGDHRLMCGSSTDPSDVKLLFGKNKASVVITDPPYGVDYGNIRESIRRSGRGGKKFKDIENDELDGKALQAFLEDTIKSCLPHLIENPAFYLWHPMLTQGTFFAAAAADILIHRQIVWVKKSLILGRGDYHWRHELCFYGWIRGKRCKWYSGRDQTTVWEISRENDGVHPTQKPIECMKRPIENNSAPGDAVYDPFIGSGTSVVAAEMTGRICLAMDIEPTYIDVVIRRWSKFSGKTAVLQGTKKTFDQIEKERSKIAA